MEFRDILIICILPFLLLFTAISYIGYYCYPILRDWLKYLIQELKE